MVARTYPIDLVVASSASSPRAAAFREVKKRAFARARQFFVVVAALFLPG